MPGLGQLGERAHAHSSLAGDANEHFLHQKVRGADKLRENV